MTALEGPERYGPLLARLAKRFDLSVDGMRQVVAEVLEHPAWQPTGAPGVSFVHFRAGPALAGTDTGFVRFEAGASFPGHRHHGRELTFVLEGVLHFSTGETLRPGDEIILGPEDRHSVAAGDRPVIYATFHEGFSVDSPGDDEG